MQGIRDEAGCHIAPVGYQMLTKTVDAEIKETTCPWKFKRKAAIKAATRLRTEAHNDKEAEHSYVPADFPMPFSMRQR
jgi:hypothetical protein